MKLTAPQTAALQYLASNNAERTAAVRCPRGDVLDRLVSLGLADERETLGTLPQINAAGLAELGYPVTTQAYVAPKVETAEPVANVLRIAPTEFSEGGTCDTCELPSHTTCPLVTGCECCEANAEEQIAEQETPAPEFVKVQTVDGYGTPHMVLQRADLAAAGRAANLSEDVNENATEEQHLAMLEEEYDALREEQDSNLPHTPRAAWVADRLNLLARHMSESAARIEQARRSTASTTGDAILVDGLLDEPSDTGDRVRHLMSDELLPACGGNDAPGDTVVDPVLDRVTCDACRATVTERDLPPVPEQRYEVQGDTTAADLRPGDHVVDASGVRQYAAFDVAPVEGSAHVEVWTAIADQERGLPVRFRLASDWSVRITRRAADVSA